MKSLNLSRIPVSLSSISRLPTINLSILETLLHGCKSSKEFPQIHAQMTTSGFVNDTFAASRLLSYSSEAPFLDLDYSRRLLFQIQHPNCFSWNTLMRAHSRRGSPHWALLLYRLMLGSDLVPDNHTCPILLQASSLRLGGLEGKQVHAQACKFGFGSDVYVVNTLVNMYSVCGDLEDARKVFDFSPVLDSVSWNSILAAYVQAGDVELAVEIFDRMPERNTIAENSMIVLFGRCKRVSDARKVFDGMGVRDVVTWTAMISCYEQNWMFKEALEVFFEMNREGVWLDEIVMVSVLAACAHLGILKEGELVHGLIIRAGLDAYVNLHNALIHLYSSCEDIIAARRLFDSAGIVDQISWNSMISGYVKCGLVEEARKYFDAMPQKDVVSWSTMISGYSQHDQFSETLELFNEMQMESIRPDETTLVGVITACARLSALEQGKWVHAYVRKNNFNINIFLGTTLVDMYMKCGCVETALTVFDEMQEREINKMLDEMNRRLKMEGYEPDTSDVAFDIEEEEKETSLYRHSEKLAIAFGLINTSPPEPIRIMKNLRICSDCHAAAKIISRAFKREILIRDRRLFHHFEEGVCSCADYW
ncbi:hypothetical protein J5N97_000068 [Dioscorea zingiberensis]|uniref:DYW domain-containing protein n=1 Tax=Dioscorea zingiberensis TaxID=325984 RepID=A0A9D5BVJ6_9LILI|nr:hypothetical protein J5N97_000068 [Dioscorea zingiberensis]